MINPKLKNSDLSDVEDLIYGIGSGIAFTVIAVCALAALAGAAFLVLSFWL